MAANTLSVTYLVPAHLLRSLKHIVSVPSRDRDEGNGSRVVADLLDEARHFLLDFLEPRFAVGGLSGVHLVDCYNELLHTQSVGEEGVLPGLSILGDTSLKFSSTGGNKQIFTEESCMPNKRILFKIELLKPYWGHVWATLELCFGYLYDIFTCRYLEPS